MMSKFYFRSTKGFTITEFMIATAIMGFFILLSFSVVGQFSSFQNSVENRLMDDFLIVNSHKVIVGDFEGSYLSRLNLFNCPSSQNLMTATDKGQATLKLDGDKFEFVKVDMASTVGLAPIVDTIVVAESNKLKVGDYILLSLASALSESGLFKVEAVDQKTNNVKVKAAVIDEPNSECRDSLGGKNLSSFFGPNIKSNVILSRILIVKYYLDKGILTRQIFPGKQSATELMDGIENVTIDSQWSPSSDDVDGKNRYGRMSYKLKFITKQGSLLSNAATYFKDQIIEAQYNLNVFHIANLYSPVGAPSVAVEFPSCSVKHEFKLGSLKIKPGLDLYRNTLPLKVTADVSASASNPAINISFTPGAGATIQCFEHNPENGTFTVDGPGINGSLTLNQSATGFNVYTCAVRGRVEMTASMSYYDTTLNQVRNVPCTVETIFAPTRFRLNTNQKPRCFKNGSWSLVSDFSGDDVTVYGGNFGIDQQVSCKWSSGYYPNAENDGMAGNCNRFLHLFQTLDRVYLRPYKIDVLAKNGKSSVFPSSGAYIDCE